MYNSLALKTQNNYSMENKLAKPPESGIVNMGSIGQKIRKLKKKISISLKIKKKKFKFFNFIPLRAEQVSKANLRSE
jgi:hypothetical protein